LFFYNQNPATFLAIARSVVALSGFIALQLARICYNNVMYSPLPKADKRFVEEFIKKTNQFFIWLKKQ